MKSFLLRFFYLMIGLFLFGLGIALTIKANIGYAPWDVFHDGFAELIGLKIGVASIIIGFIVLIIVTIFKEKFGLGTILNMILIGIYIDLLSLIIPEIEVFYIGIIVLIAGLFIVAFGTYFYVKSGFGAGPRDNLMVVLVRKTKLSAGVCRIIIEILMTVSGWLLGGMVGVGTIIAAIAVGFCIQIVFKLFKFDITAVKHESLIETFPWLRRRVKRSE